MQLNNMSTHQPGAEGADHHLQHHNHHQHRVVVESPTIRLVPGSVPISIPLFRLRNVSFIHSPPHPVAEPNGTGSPAFSNHSNHNQNNNNYDFYKPSAGMQEAEGGDEPAQIKLETADCELGTETSEPARPESSETGSSYGNQDSRSPPLAGSAVRQSRKSGRTRMQADADPEDADEEGLEEEEEDGEEEDEEEGGERAAMVMDEPGEESNDTGGAAEMDDSEQDDNKLAPQDQEKMTQAVKKVFTEYKWTPPVAPIRCV
uniref:Uncharacterized protein n=1 Tax=Anopheles epiroticus TaxID=199890 RepID=A0A182PL33_9DIPT